MAKRILVVPDVHGRTFWKKPVNKYIDQVDRIVFLGDYLDPYRDEGEEHEVVIPIEDIGTIGFKTIRNMKEQNNN